MINTHLDANAAPPSQHLFNTTTPLPIEVAAADGIEIITTDGRRLMDFWCDEGVSSLGYNNPDVLQWMVEHYNRVGALHIPQMFPWPARERVAGRLCERAGFDKVCFGNSGTEANEVMLKLARKVWHDRAKLGHPGAITADGGPRFSIWTKRNHWHGRTLGALAASDCKQNPYHKEGFHVPTVGYHVWDNVDEIPPDAGAVLMSPVLGNNVVETFPPSLFKELKLHQQLHGTLILFDEIQVGMGRTGYFCAYQHPEVGIKPDIITLGKGIGAGLPLSACLTSNELAASITPGTHYSTFGGNPLALMLMELALDVLTPSFLEQVAATGAAVRTMLRSNTWVKSVDGYGIHNAFTPDWRWLAQTVGREVTGYDICHVARDFGLLLVTHRPFGPIRFTPSIIVSRLQALEAIDRLERAVKSLWGE